MRVLSLREAGQGIRFLYRGDNGAEYGHWVQGLPLPEPDLLSQVQGLAPAKRTKPTRRR